MTDKVSNEVQVQRDYYAETAVLYDKMHVNPHGKDEHYLAMAFMLSAIEYFEIQSVLDIGSGTGRALKYLKNRKPELRIVGVEPVGELRQIGHEKGLSEDELVDGDATRLGFSDGAFDLVCEFGVLHHIKHPEHAVSEMLRVANKAIFISDSNNFGQGSLVARSIKQLINAFGLWPVADFIKTKGKGYTISEGDGLSYSYSVFNNYEDIKRNCKNIHLLNTTAGQINPYRTSSHVALLGIK
jgi:ubiquinone/menaquinone biosynthesis C-methylase UbiE